MLGHDISTRAPDLIHYLVMSALIKGLCRRKHEMFVPSHSYFQYYIIMACTDFQEAAAGMKKIYLLRLGW
jgi:hypothetical protein